MKKQYINIAGKDFAPLAVGFGECCLNCDIKKSSCHFQCHYFEDSEEENVALKEVKHEKSLNFWQRVRKWFEESKWFMPIESELPF